MNYIKNIIYLKTLNSDVKDYDKEVLEGLKLSNVITDYKINEENITI